MTVYAAPTHDPLSRHSAGGPQPNCTSGSYTSLGISLFANLACSGVVAGGMHTFLLLLRRPRQSGS